MAKTSKDERIWRRYFGILVGNKLARGTLDDLQERFLDTSLPLYSGVADQMLAAHKKRWPDPEETEETAE